MRRHLVFLFSAVLAIGAASSPAAAGCPPPDGDGLLGELRRLVAVRATGCAVVDVMPLDGAWLAEIDPGRHALSNLSLSADGTSFAAAVVDRAPGGTSRIARIVRGRVVQLQQVPVAIRRVMPGERIAPEDVRLTYVDARQVPPNAITSIRDAEGLEPRWPVPPNAVLTRAQLKAPLVIERGDVVTAEYRANNIELTTKAVAIDGGARGQVIRVRNASSNKTIQGRVTDVGRVVIE